jgi:hypothetical protein
MLRRFKRRSDRSDKRSRAANFRPESNFRTRVQAWYDGTMAIYRIIEDSDAYNSVVYSENEVPLETIQRLNGIPQSTSWKPIPVQIYSVGKGADFLRFVPAVPVVTERAWATLSHLLQSHAELLPLANTSSQLKLFALHVTSVVDCLDHDKASIRRFPEGNPMYPLERYAFIESIADRYPVFRLPETLRSELLATEAFREVALRAKISGLLFEQLS